MTEARKEKRKEGKRGVKRGGGKRKDGGEKKIKENGVDVLKKEKEGGRSMT